MKIFTSIFFRINLKIIENNKSDSHAQNLFNPNTSIHRFSISSFRSSNSYFDDALFYEFSIIFFFFLLFIREMDFSSNKNHFKKIDKRLNKAHRNQTKNKMKIIFIAAIIIKLNGK